MENKERKNGEVDQRNSKKTWLEAKILGARSLTEEHKQPMISDGQYPKNTKKYQELLKDKPQPKSNYDFIINLSGKHLIQLIQQSKRYLY